VNIGIARRRAPLAIDSVKVSATGRNCGLQNRLANGELYLLKATGTIGAGANTVDAELRLRPPAPPARMSSLVSMSAWTSAARRSVALPAE